MSLTSTLQIAKGEKGVVFCG